MHGVSMGLGSYRELWPHVMYIIWKQDDKCGYLIYVLRGSETYFKKQTFCSSKGPPLGFWKKSKRRIIPPPPPSLRKLALYTWVHTHKQRSWYYGDRSPPGSSRKNLNKNGITFLWGDRGLRSLLVFKH